MFNVQDFLGTSFDQPLDTRRPNIPPGDYVCQVGTGEKDLMVESGEKDGRPWAKLTVRIYVTDPSGAIKKATGLEKPFVNYDMFLDLTPDGKFDSGKGKNTKVGKLLECGGKLKPGWKPSDLRGATIKAKIGQRMYNGEQYDEVQGITTP